MAPWAPQVSAALCVRLTEGTSLAVFALLKNKASLKPPSGAEGLNEVLQVLEVMLSG
jgi:hypothetical protein